MSATPAAVREDFDRLAAFEGRLGLDHSAHYFPWLERRLPSYLGEVCEVGTGGGAFTERLAARSRHVLGLDFSPAMIALARARLAGVANVELAELDAHDWRPAPRSLDAIVSIATLHHLDAAAVLPRWAAALRPGGVLLVLDILERSSLADFPVNAAAALWSGWLRWRRTGHITPDREVREAWRDHMALDHHPSLAAARDAARRALPGARVRSLFLWRYAIEWRAPAPPTEDP